MKQASIEIHRESLVNFLSQSRFNFATFCRDYTRGKELLRDSISVDATMGKVKLTIVEGEQLDKPMVEEPKDVADLFSEEDKRPREMPC